MKTSPVSPSKAIRGLAAFAAVFGVLSVFSGGSVLFGPDAARTLAGHYLPFVVWFNFLAGFVYVAAAFGLWQGRRWAFALSLLIAGATGLVALAFAYRVSQGAVFEPRTIGALALRTGLWSLIALVQRVT